MIAIPAGACVYLALAPTDMRKGFDGLSMLAQQALAQDPFSGSLFVFRGKRGDPADADAQGRTRDRGRSAAARDRSGTRGHDGKGGRS